MHYIKYATNLLSSGGMRAFFGTFVHSKVIYPPERCEVLSTYSS